MSEPIPYAQDSSALAFALTRTKLSLPYSVEVACDLEQFSLAARREARRERCKRASAIYFFHSFSIIINNNNNTIHRMMH